MQAAVKLIEQLSADAHHTTGSLGGKKKWPGWRVAPPADRNAAGAEGGGAKGGGWCGGLLEPVDWALVALLVALLLCWVPFTLIAQAHRVPDT